MDLTNTPVTIVVKAPNQKFEDQTVECLLGWTVQKLKQHLASVYPTKPKEGHQRLIYSGKLLNDGLQLKDILRKDNGNSHTVHLVCTTSTDGTVRSASTPVLNNMTESLGSNMSSSTEPSIPDGLRHRGLSHMPTTPNLLSYQHHAYGNNQNMQGLNAQQMFWMQQMYAQQMVQYMQYVQQNNLQTNTDLAPGFNHVPNMNTPPLAPGVAAPPQRNNAGNRPGAGMRMNAQGGAVDDDDEEEGNRDWLDWVYVFSRASVLFAILYFYSTFGRFVLVLGFFVLAWLYNTGFFQLNRRQPRRVEEVEEVNVHENNDQDQANTPQDQEQNEDSGDNNQTDNTEPPPPPRSSIFGILWTFFLTFFTSLVPENPQAVALN